MAEEKKQVEEKKEEPKAAVSSAELLKQVAGFPSSEPAKAVDINNRLAKIEAKIDELIETVSKRGPGRPPNSGATA